MATEKKRENLEQASKATEKKNRKPRTSKQYIDAQITDSVNPSITTRRT